MAADIMPAATHLTTSILSSAHPTKPFEQTQVHLLPYGRQGREASADFALGALDLIRKQHGTGLFENTGIEVHRGQAAMSRLLMAIRQKVEEPAGHGNAGLASNFLDLADAKVKPGGILAMVMPLILLQGKAWAASRNLLESRYERAMVLGLATGGRDDAKSFSADTGMGAVLVIARRKRPATFEGLDPADCPVSFVALRKRPASTTEAVGLAAAIRAAEQGGRSRVMLGEDLWGVRVSGTWDDGSCASIVHPEVVETVRALHGVACAFRRRVARTPSPLRRCGRWGLAV